MRSTESVVGRVKLREGFPASQGSFPIFLVIDKIKISMVNLLEANNSGTFFIA
jgi:hypothetical protein